MNISEAKSAVKALYLQSAALAGFEVGPQSPERFVALLNRGFAMVEDARRPEAVANILKVIAATLEEAQKAGVTELHEGDVDAGEQKVSPVYPFN